MKAASLAFAGLLSLLALSVAVSYVAFGPLGWAVGVVIASIKSWIVIVVFMEFRPSCWEAKAAAGVGLAWLCIFLGLLYIDYSQR